MYPWDFSELDVKKKAALIGFIKVKIDREKNRPRLPKPSKSAPRKRR